MTVIMNVGDLHGSFWIALRTAVALVWLAAVLVLLARAGAALRSYRPQQRGALVARRGARGPRTPRSSHP